MTFGVFGDISPGDSMCDSMDYFSGMELESTW